MFKCEFCTRSFTTKDHLKRHGDCRITTQFCHACQSQFKSKGSFERHMREKHSAPKRSATDAPPAPMAKRAKLDPQDVPSTSAVQHCGECNLDVPKSEYQGHLRTLRHKENCCVDQEEGVKLIKTSFRNRISTHQLSSSEDPTNVKKFLEHFKSKFVKLVGNHLQRFRHLKVGMELFGRFLLPTKETMEVKSFNMKFQLVSEGTDLEELFNQFVAILDKKAMEFEEKDSGWVLQQLLHVEISINKINPIKASSYLPLPKEIQAKKAIINIQNTDEKCFMWSVLAALHKDKVKYNRERISHYQKYADELDFTGMEFPIKLIDISKFERLNNISINVYGLETVFENGRNKSEVVGPLYFTTSRKLRHVNLLVISDDSGNQHYCLINSMSKLISRQLSGHHGGTKYLCDGCLTYFYSDQKLKAHQKHDCGHVLAKVPTTNLKKNKYGEEVPENLLKFTEFEKKLKVPFVVYADFETILEPIDTEQNEMDPKMSYTVKTHKHIPYSFAYYIKCDFNDTHSIFKSFRGQDAHKKFVSWLETDCTLIYNQFLKNSVPMSPLTCEQEIEFRNTSNCHICEKPFDAEDERVRDHCHLTGHFRGAAHSVCNLNYKIPTFIPIFFHNMSGFDSHLFIKELALKKEKLDVIPQNKERYISFTKHILVDNIKNKAGKQQNVFLQLRFLDSFRFMPSSLDKLGKNLKPEQCREIRKYFPDENKFQLIRQKGVFPYSYVDRFSKLNDKKLPSHKSFFNNLKNEGISIDDYKRAWKVWNLFECKTLGHYSDIYLKSDVLILADVFENFREVCLETYKLDPAQFFTSPGLSFSSALRYTQIELELLTDLDMIHFLKRGIRGGVSQCSVRKAIANNKFIPHYSASKPTSYIMYLDATNLYGAAMSQYLPLGNFKWLNDSEIQNLDYKNIVKNSTTGYILEVDLDYPEELHYIHNELPFCPQTIPSPESKVKNVTKLIPNLENKTKYIIHYQNLQQCLDHGLKLTKIHRVLTFDQSPWLKPYIDLNTAKRNQAQNKFEKDFFKLMNNAVFGKTMENVEKRVDVKLITHWENNGRKLGAEALLAKPHFKNVTVFNENLVAIQMAKQKVTYNKPIYAGFCILEISKTIMYDFLYSYIKPKYGNSAVLLYTDTDSLILHVTTKNFYDDMRENLDKFDTSNYLQDNPHNIPVNTSVLGRMKDEYAGKVVWEFYGTGAKAYCVNVEGELTKKAKGVPDYVTKKELSIDDYKLAVDVEGTEIHREMSTFRSHLHDMYVELKKKVALSYADDKRYVRPDSEYTLAWGHRDIAKYRE